MGGWGEVDQRICVWGRAGPSLLGAHLETVSQHQVAMVYFSLYVGRRGRGGGIDRLPAPPCGQEPPYSGGGFAHGVVQSPPPLQRVTKYPRCREYGQGGGGGNQLGKGGGLWAVSGHVHNKPPSHHHLDAGGAIPKGL